MSNHEMDELSPVSFDCHVTECIVASLVIGAVGLCFALPTGTALTSGGLLGANTFSSVFVIVMSFWVENRLANAMGVSRTSWSYRATLAGISAAVGAVVLLIVHSAWGL